MRLPSLRKMGLELAPGVMLRTSEQPGGGWVAWIEQDNAPLEITSGSPRLFEGATRYQAQCEAMRWIRSDSSCAELRTRVRESERGSRSSSVGSKVSAAG